MLDAKFIIRMLSWLTIVNLEKYRRIFAAKKPVSSENECLYLTLSTYGQIQQMTNRCYSFQIKGSISHTNCTLSRQFTWSAEFHPPKHTHTHTHTHARTHARTHTQHTRTHTHIKTSSAEISTQHAVLKLLKSFFFFFVCFFDDFTT